MSFRNVLVIPYERTSSRAGTAAGARLIAGIIRSQGLGERLDVLEVEDTDPAKLTTTVLERIHGLPAPRVIFGGNHLVSYPAMIDYVRSGGKRILVFDAHHDAYQIGELTHYSHLHHLVAQFGAEVTVVGCRHECEAADPRIRMLPMEKLGDFLESRDRRLYFSLDLDAIDPAEFASVNHPVRGGMRFTDALAAVRQVLEHRPECLDLVEASFGQHCSSRSLSMLSSLIDVYLAYSSSTRAGTSSAA